MHKNMNELEQMWKPDNYILGIGIDGINTVNYIYKRLGNSYYQKNKKIFVTQKRKR